jgi:hypothetical protein
MPDELRLAIHASCATKFESMLHGVDGVHMVWLHQPHSHWTVQFAEREINEKSGAGTQGVANLNCGLYATEVGRGDDYVHIYTTVLSNPFDSVANLPGSQYSIFAEWWVKWPLFHVIRAMPGVILPEC